MTPTWSNRNGPAVTTLICVHVGRGASGTATTGATRFLAVTTGDLHRLRQRCRIALAEVPDDRRPPGQSPDQTVEQMVNLMLAANGAAATTDVYDWTLPDGHTVRMVTDRARHLGVTAECRMPAADDNAPRTTNHPQ